jgi:hypothetical protein
MGSLIFYGTSLGTSRSKFELLDLFPSLTKQHSGFLAGGLRGILRICMLLAVLGALPFHPLFAQTPAVLISPAPGSVLPGSTVTFTWSAGTGEKYYQLHLNTQPGNPTDPAKTRLYESGAIPVLSQSWNQVPTTGGTIYAILGSSPNYGGPFTWTTYAYTEAGGTPPTPSLSGLSCANGSITGAATDSCTVTLNTAAATGGFAVSLASNDTAVTVPASVTVAAGATSASFSATASSVSTAQTATLTATAGSTSKTFAIQLGASVPTLSVSSSTLSFGNVNVNTATTQSVTLTSSGTASLTVSAAAVSGTGFSVSGATFPLTLSPNQTATLTVQFDPTAAGAASGTLTLTSNSSTGSSTAISLSGTGVPVLTGLSCANGSMTAAGTDSCTVTLNAAAASGGFAVSLASNDSAVSVPASVTVAAGATSASFSATVSTVSSAQTATLTATAGSTSKTFAIQLGTGTPALSINATSIPFGNVDLDWPSTQSLTLTSTGTASVTVSAATVSGTGFSISGVTFPLTLSPNQTATLNVQFDPTAVGAVSGSLTITSNSSTNPTVTVSLTGTGVAYQVNLTWSAPTGGSDPVVGYNVYRAPAGSTSYQQVNTSPVTQTAYTDTTVQCQKDYDYMVESIDSNGIESVPSNMAAMNIP